MATGNFKYLLRLLKGFKCQIQIQTEIITKDIAVIQTTLYYWFLFLYCTITSTEINEFEVLVKPTVELNRVQDIGLDRKTLDTFRPLAISHGYVIL